MRSLLSLSFCLCIAIFSYSQQASLQYYLPDVKYDPAVPTPESFLGHQVGTWHIGHDQLVYYMKALAESSDRVVYREYARSYENRPLIVLTVTAPENHQQLDEIKAKHVALSDPARSGQVNYDDMPVVIWQGYSIHGNEASGANAAVLYAYYLAAAQGAVIEKQLEEAVILLDPCFNPDGFNRFASWVNVHKSKQAVTKIDSREFNEAWPGGRTNHYWFDLNRDWMPSQHPESQGRLKVFHEWKPNILTDHHEMGSNSTFFFMPGEPSRTNPLTPQINQDLTGDIARYHVAELDKIGSLYYSKEGFDDFYYGKGSTYPDANGCIGILFEQASARGHIRETKNGLLSFPFAIRNQVATSLSTLAAGQGLRRELLKFQRDFYKNAFDKVKNSETKAYVFKSLNDQSRLKAFVDLLHRHHIKVYRADSKVTVKDQSFSPDNSLVVPIAQAQSQMIRALFQRRTEFKDSLFYDVSAWTMPLAFGLEYDPTGKVKLGNEIKSSSELNPVTSKIDEEAYAYAIDWKDYYAPKYLYRLLDAGLLVKVATRQFDAKVKTGMINFDYGTLIVPAVNKQMTRKAVAQLMNEIAEEGAKVTNIYSGYSDMGKDLGSNSKPSLKKPEILLVAGSGASAYDVGEVWHLFDQRYEIPVTLVEASRLASTDLSAYTTIVMVNGSYGSITKSASNAMREWISEGGVLVASRDAVRWATASGLANIKTVRMSSNTKNGKKRKAYKDASRDSGGKVTGGAIVEAILDLSHPLSYGYANATIPLFRRGNYYVQPSNNPYATPLVYTSKPLLSGYMHKDNQKALKNGAGIIVTGIGRGRVISLMDNMNFRAFWYGTNKLFANAVFFGNLIRSDTVERTSMKSSTKK